MKAKEVHFDVIWRMANCYEGMLCHELRPDVTNDSKLIKFIDLRNQYKIVSIT
jgi:hypothetical protein